jgi:hypothetical protein
MTTPPAIEKRKHPRFPVQFRSSFSSVNLVGGEGLLLDLSVRGCQIETGTPVQPGTELRLLIHVSQDGDPLEIAVARVRWSQGPRFGAEFADIQNEAWKRLCRVIKDLEHPSAAQVPPGAGTPPP